LFIIKINAIPMVARIKNLRKKHPVFFFISLFQSVLLDLFYFFRLFFIPFDSIFNSLYSKKKADKVHCNQVNSIHFLLSFYFSGQLTIFCKT